MKVCTCQSRLTTEAIYQTLRLPASSVSDIYMWQTVTVHLRIRRRHKCKPSQYQTLLSTVVYDTTRPTSYVICMQPTYSRWPQIRTGMIMWYRGRRFRDCILSVVRTVGAKVLLQSSLFHFIVPPAQCQACVTLRPPSLLITSTEASKQSLYWLSCLSSLHNDNGIPEVKPCFQPTRVCSLWAGIAQSVLRLATGWTVQGWNPGRGGEIPHTSRSTLGPPQPPVQQEAGLFLWGKTAGAWLCPPTPT